MTKPARLQQGFTILELIVALGLGAIISLTLFTLTAGSGRIFHEQQRVAHTQLNLRNAVERVRADIARAGYLTTPHSEYDPNVCPPGFPCPSPSFQGVSLTDGVGWVPLSATNALARPDQLDLFGAFDDTNVYFSETIQAGVITLDTNSASYRQRFGSAPPASVPALLAESFYDPANPTAKVVRIHCPGEPRAVFQATTAPVVVDGMGRPRITFGAWRGIGPYDPGMGIRCEISSASFVRYTVRNVCAAFPSTCRMPEEAQAGTLPKSDLVRIDLTRDSPPVEIPARTQIVAEYAVDFDVRFDADAALVPLPGQVNPPESCRTTYAGAPAWATLGAGSLAGRLRAIEFRLSVRTRDEEPSFPWVAPGGVLSATDPVVQRFELNAVSFGAARVRTMRTKVELASFAAAHIQRPAQGAAACSIP